MLRDILKKNFFAEKHISVTKKYVCFVFRRQDNILNQ